MQPVLRREGFWLLRCRQAGGGERRPWGLRPPWSEAVGAGPVGAVRELGPRYVSEVEPTGLAEARLERRISWARTQRSEGPRAAGWPQTPWPSVGPWRTPPAGWHPQHVPWAFGSDAGASVLTCVGQGSCRPCLRSWADQSALSSVLPKTLLTLN